MLFGAGLHEQHSMGLGIRQGLLSGNLSILLEITFIADQHGDNVRRTVYLDFVEPVLDVFETGVVSNVIDKHDPVAAFVICTCDSLEPSKFILLLIKKSLITSLVQLYPTG